ncbi:hypothetical protein GCM10009678_03300 [Actinomadura kijaniata]|uniref:Uncharacterized protein n=1 Tax=Actinomadura namibiensis TaxID=182080 RepID=A0A7W3LTN4_ACTNM|nr:hypothetical protein [Actinomadura namibiensis]MBA8954098.1 hypothetical protein [Actinomadura namibiensis]
MPTGIRHFWRVEEEATGSYVATGIHRDRVVVEVPFGMDIDLKRLVRL